MMRRNLRPPRPACRDACYVMLAMARKVCVELSPVMTMAGISSLEFLLSFAMTSTPLGPLGRLKSATMRSGRSVDAKCNDAHRLRRLGR